MMRNWSTAVFTLVASGVVAGCNADFGDDQQTTAGQPLAACVGDDVNYDYNAFAASLAVAIANELGRWDVTADFEVRNGKLELSATGVSRCNGGCNNVSALLRLQDDAASTVPNHSPSIYRSKLTSWYGTQANTLKSLVGSMLNVDKGVYRLKARHSGKYMAVDNGSTSDYAGIEQRSSVTYAGADQWRMQLDGTKHKFVNIRSGKCLSLASSTDSTNRGMNQQTCSTSDAQKFDFASLGSGYYAIRTMFGLALDVGSASQSEDAAVIQYSWSGEAQNQHWYFEKVGTTGHVDPSAVATAVYTIKADHSGKVLGVDNGSLSDGALIEQSTYVASEDRFHWYVIRSGNYYTFVNRRSGKCIGLLTDASTSRLAQQTCNSSVHGQSFTLGMTGDGNHVIYSKFGQLWDVEGGSVSDGALVTQYGGGWAHHRQFTLTPIIAGEPHKLTYAYKTADAECGEYNYWYNILRPNGQSLNAPQDTYVQLIFAGGKQTRTGTDVNPFIAQQISGNLVAIDPTSGLNEGTTTTSGSCAAACSKYSTASLVGQCCSCNGMSKKFVRSTFSSYMYLCTGY